MLRQGIAVKRKSLNTQDIERHVGQRIRERRTMLGLTQQQLAELIDVTYQQAHKYERGINRVSAGRLYELAMVLGVDVGYFFADVELASEEESLSGRQRMCLDLARNFSKIGDERQQEAIAQLARVLARESDEDA
ncbi:helix-turn-helix domain-containing protein [Rhodovibrio salinarum]|uniref:XRE family transcriptional regulator n=1 Tax=Rhodovibrio salinarum TaxID=1087 RepID=A0A934QN25_9PROT|nr:helix-turn-helix transcriptional regulator [Rhodovibrio salinarum]MBK1699290.1 XRE family transcriptional regulator [Rhodovibrio salinarum]